MLSLDGLQSAVAASVLGQPHPTLFSQLGAGQSDPLRRLRIYQNNTRASLTATLIAVFPVTVRLVDERFFRYAADAFIRQTPPTEPRLSSYGASFPAFLRTFGGLADMPFVAETARLEWAIAEALDARPLPHLGLDALETSPAQASPEIALQPSLRLIISHWPVLSIWKAHQNGATPDDAALFTRRGERLALWRHGDSLRFVALAGAAYSLRASLKAGLGLEKAVSRALTHEPMFDLVDALVCLFGDGLVTGVTFPDPNTQEI